MIKYIVAGAATIGVATSVNAASLISASVSGVANGVLWNTTVDNIRTLFIGRPLTGVINPTDNFTSITPTTGMNSFFILGDGFPTGTSTNSDATYTVTLQFADGATISGVYAGSTFTGGTTATVGGTTYTLTGFGWDRSPVDNVSPFSATPGGDPFDYTGQFAFTATAVPEMATWAMMIAGFGLVGATMRRQRQARITALS